jgi:hypothetical protein
MGHLNLQNILFMFHHIHVTFKFREFGAAASNPIVSNGLQQSIGRETNNPVFRCGTFYHSSRTSAMELSDIA